MRKVIPLHRRNLIVLNIRKHRRKRDRHGKGVKENVTDNRNRYDDPAPQPLSAEFVFPFNGLFATNGIACVDSPFA